MQGFQDFGSLTVEVLGLAAGGLIIIDALPFVAIVGGGVLAGDGLAASWAAAFGGGATAAATDVETAGPVAAETSVASANVSKFSEYLFKEGATHGKAAIFERFGYSAANSKDLAALYEEQAAAKFKAGEYTLGKADEYGNESTSRLIFRVSEMRLVRLEKLDPDG